MSAGSVANEEMMALKMPVSAMRRNHNNAARIERAIPILDRKQTLQLYRIAQTVRSTKSAESEG
jgi:hypothetical protein